MMQNFKNLGDNLSDSQKEKVQEVRHKLESEMGIFRSLGHVFQIYVGELEGTFIHLFEDVPQKKLDK